MKRFYMIMALLVSVLAAKAKLVQIDGIWYDINQETKVATVTNDIGGIYSGSQCYSGNVVIPERVNYEEMKYSVTSIGKGAFSGCFGLTSVTIPNSVTSIGREAFSNCFGLTSVTIGSSVTSIGDGAFRACHTLTKLTVESGNMKYDSRENCNCIVETESNTLVFGCANSVIPNSVTSIGDGAFKECSGLTSIDIPKSMTSIGGHAFEYCSGLTSIDIPNSVTSIGESAFFGCSGLTSVIVESGNTNYDSRENCNCIIETRSNTLLLGCANSVIPNSVTSIGYGAFWTCDGLTSVTIGNSVTSIGGYAFLGCSGLTSIDIPKSVKSIGYGAFEGCSGLTSVIVESGNTKYDSRENCNCIIETRSNTLLLGCANSVIPNSVTSIGDGAFSECTDLTSVTIPNSVTSIGYGAFSGCPDLTSVTIGNSVTSIGDYAFYSCPDLTSVTIPNSVTSIGRYVFSWCIFLTSVTIGNSVTSIGEGAFENCNNLRDVYSINSTPPSCGNDVFSEVKVANCRLHVPKGAREDYAIADGWRDFYNIIEDIEEDTTGGNNLDVNELRKRYEMLIRGDLNMDGKTDIEDIALLLSLDSYSSDKDALAVLTDGTTTSVAEIAEKLGEVEYFTLDGKKVAKPTESGIYLVKKNGETKMVVVKK